MTSEQRPPVNNDHYFRVQRVVVVYRFECNLLFLNQNESLMERTKSIHNRRLPSIPLFDDDGCHHRYSEVGGVWFIQSFSWDDKLCKTLCWTFSDKNPGTADMLRNSNKQYVRLSFANWRYEISSSFSFKAALNIPRINCILKKK